ncbi:Phosphate regulon sensor protein PhoR [compost metagenome]
MTERFYRIDAEASRKKKGTGLGLAIVKHIIQRHRGQMSIRSQPGEGLRVDVLLP